MHPRRMIEVKNITKTFGTHKAVDNISFSVKDGDSAVFLGTSGCGKTTLLKMINRLLEPDSGEIRIGGRRIRDQRPEELRRGIGYVFQNNGLFPHYTIEENIGIVPRLLGWDQPRIAARAVQLMEKLRLPPGADTLALTPTSSAGASNSGSASPGRWPPILRYY